MEQFWNIVENGILHHNPNPVFICMTTQSFSNVNSLLTCFFIFQITTKQIPNPPQKGTQLKVKVHNIKITYCCIEYTSSWVGIELTILIVRHDCICACSMLLIKSLRIWSICTITTLFTLIFLLLVEKKNYSTFYF
jgi:hypothetical protein